MSSLTCGLCEDKKAIYSCPRCNLPYCSVECYKSPTHSNCSESFYKECIEEELKSEEPDTDSRKRMMEILKRNYELDVEDDYNSADSDDDFSLEERLKGINLDDTNQVWDALTEEEHQEFLELASQGDVTKLVPLWEPWWLQRHEKPKVTTVDDEKTDSVSYKESCPSIFSPIPVLETICVKVVPSPLVFNNLMNVLSSYCFTTRFFNGEHMEHPSESSFVLWKLARNLSCNQIYDSLELAIESVGKESVDDQNIGASQENIDLMKSDVAKVALGPNKEDPSYYALSALSDIHSLLSSVKGAKRNFSAVPGSPNLPVEFYKKIESDMTKKQNFLAIKKVEYYMSWVNSCYIDIVGCLEKILSRD